MIVRVIGWWRDFRDMVRGLERMRELKMPEHIIEGAWKPWRPRTSVAFMIERSMKPLERMTAMIESMKPRIVRAPPAHTPFTRARDRDDMGPYRS